MGYVWKNQHVKLQKEGATTKINKKLLKFTASLKK